MLSVKHMYKSTLKEKYIDPNDFSMMIIRRADETNDTILSTLTIFAEELNIPVEEIKPKLNRDIIERIANECRSLRLLKDNDDENTGLLFS